MDAQLSLITTGGYHEISATTSNSTTNLTTINSTTNLITTTPHITNNDITTTPHTTNNALAIGLGVGIPCGVLLLVGIAVLIYFLVKRKNHQGLCTANDTSDAKDVNPMPKNNLYETAMPIPRVRQPESTYYNVSYNPYEIPPDESVYETTLNLK